MKVVGSFNIFRKLFSEYKLAVFFTSWNKYHKVVTPDVIIICKNTMAREGAEEGEFLTYSNKFP